MPTPRYKSLIVSRNDNSVTVFYAGRNAALMNKDAVEQFTRFYPLPHQNADVKVEEKFFNNNEWLFSEAIQDFRKTNEVEYTPKVNGIGARWVVVPKQTEENSEGRKITQGDIDEMNAGIEAGAKSVAEIARETITSPSIPFQVIQGRVAAVPIPDPNGFESIPPRVIEAAPDQSELFPEFDPSVHVITESELKKERQKHEIVDPVTGVRTTFETDGPPDWGGQEIPAGYRRIDGDPVVEQKPFQHEYDPSLVDQSPLQGEPGDVIETDATVYTKNDIALHDGQYSKGDARYFGESEYERAKNNIRPVNWDLEYAAIPSEPVDQDQIDTGELQNPANMKREIEELRQNPSTEDQKHDNEKMTGVRTYPQSTPHPGRRSNSMFGVVPQ